MDSMTTPRLGRRAGLVMRRVRGVICSPGPQYIFSRRVRPAAAASKIYTDTNSAKIVYQRKQAIPDQPILIKPMPPAIESSLPSQASKKNP